MKIDYAVSNDDEFHAGSWWAKSPDFVLKTLRTQLEAAAVIWPELGRYRIDPAATSKATRGRQGGFAAAAKLSPEERTDRAKAAAHARWGDKSDADAGVTLESGANQGDASR